MDELQVEWSSELVLESSRLIADISQRLDSDEWVVINNSSASSIEKVYVAAALRHCASLLEEVISAFNNSAEMTLRILGRSHIEAFLYGAYIHFGGIAAIRMIRMSEDTSQKTMHDELVEWDKFLSRTIKKNTKRGKKVGEVRAQIEIHRPGGLTAKEREQLAEPHVPRPTYRKEAIAHLGRGLETEETVEFGVFHAVSWLSEQGPILGFATERFDPLYHLYRAYSSIGPHPNLSVYESYVLRDQKKTFIRTTAKPLKSIAFNVLLDSVVSTAQLAEWILDPDSNGTSLAGEVRRRFEGAEDNYQGWKPKSSH